MRPAARGLVVTTEYYWDLLRKNLLCKCMGLIFAMGQNFFEKTGFLFLSFGDIFTFPNGCAIQNNLGTKELLKKTVLENIGYWQNGLEIEKKVCCHKVTLG